MVKDGARVGAINVGRKLHDPEESCFYISPLFFLPKYQNQGIGYVAIQKFFSLYPDIKVCPCFLSLFLPVFTCFYLFFVPVFMNFRANVFRSIVKPKSTQNIKYENEKNRYLILLFFGSKIKSKGEITVPHFITVQYKKQ